MAKLKLTIQHNNVLYEPPVEDGVKIEWERTGSPGKLTFTTVGISSGLFTEGDPVCFYYDGKPIFMGYVFTKKHDKENKISVTCYDQIRYLKNKFTYVFEKKTATQIVQALCKDMNLYTGTMDNSNYVIPAVAEENTSALDIILKVLEDTLLNTGNMFVVYDDFGKISIRNASNMVSDTLIYEDTAENFDFSSSIDDETYNQVVLYYKQNDQITQMYTAQSPTTIRQWGVLRYFEEVKTPTIGQNKANTLLKMYNRKTRELKITGAFGDVSVRGGTLIPVKLSVGDENINNFMLVEKVTHTFSDNHHTMDLTLDGAWDDKTYKVESKIIGELVKESTTSGGLINTEVNDTATDDTIEKKRLTINQIIRSKPYCGTITVTWVQNGITKVYTLTSNHLSGCFDCDVGTTVEMHITKYWTEDYSDRRLYRYDITKGATWKTESSTAGDVTYKKTVKTNETVTVSWLNTYDRW